jgi:hypothetical protein
MKVTSDYKVIYKTNELGVFEEVLNWKEVKEQITNSLNKLKKEFKNVPEFDKMLQLMVDKFSSKEAIESTSIKDIQQFHNFHGAKYTLNEVLEYKMQVPNILGKKPFDSDVTLYLDVINEEDDNFILRATQVVNKEQLTKATFDYLVQMSKTMNLKTPKRSDIGELGNEIISASIIHSTGWIIYSVQTVTITSDNITKIEERIMEIKGS